MGEVNQDTILQHQRKRRRHKIKLAVGSFVVILVAIILIATYAILSKNYYNEYKENAEVEYKIRLNENEFYTGEYLEGSTGVVASIIKDIEAEFKYKLDLKEEQDYIYDYKILSQIEVKEGSRENSIYTIEEEIASKPATETNSKQLEIDEKFIIDYNEYNRKISSEENLQGYKILKIGTFNEILEMRDTIQAPILMYAENEERTKFMIINNDVLFVYVLGVKEIRNELREKAKNKKQKAKK